jgi:hypothetical protein
MTRRWSRQPPDPGRPTRPYVSSEPAPPKRVDSALPEGIEAQIVRGLELAARTRRAPKWLDNVADKWLAEASKKDAASVRASRERYPTIRERDMADSAPRVTQDGGLSIRHHVRTSIAGDQKPRGAVSLTPEERAAKRRLVGQPNVTALLQTMEILDRLEVGVISSQESYSLVSPPGFR